MLEKGLRVGDYVKVVDGSYVVRMDKYETRSFIGKGLVCVVIYIDWKNFGPVHSNDNFRMYDIHIKDVKDGGIYLHTSRFVKKVPKTKTVYKIFELSKMMETMIAKGYKPQKSGDWMNKSNFVITSNFLTIAGETISRFQVHQYPNWLIEKVEVEIDD